MIVSSGNSIQFQATWRRIRQRPLLGTYVEIGVSARRDVQEADLDGAINAAFGAVETVQRLMSFHDPDSDLSRLNCSGGRSVVVHPMTRRALYLARQMTFSSGGRFNCTVGGALVARGALPDHGAPYVPNGRADHIVFGEKTVCLMGNVLVTLDGIAKGFAVDVAIRALKARGMTAAYINAGGDLRTYGPFPMPVFRRVLDGSMAPLGALQDAAIATSQSCSHESERFGGLIVGISGQTPVPGVWTVLARQAWRADALTKVVALCAVSERAALIEKLRGQWVE